MPPQTPVGGFIVGGDTRNRWGTPHWTDWFLLVVFYGSLGPIPIRGNQSFEGGNLICISSGVYWIVAPGSSEVARTWYLRNDANTTAQSVSGCTGWFVPTCAQLQNPGYCCRTFWDSFFSTRYWSSTESNATAAFPVNFTNGTADPGYGAKDSTFCVRAFRCVTYWYLYFDTCILYAS